MSVVDTKQHVSNHPTAFQIPIISAHIIRCVSFTSIFSATINLSAILCASLLFAFFPAFLLFVASLISCLFSCRLLFVPSWFLSTYLVGSNNVKFSLSSKGIQQYTYAKKGLLKDDSLRSISFSFSFFLALSIVYLCPFDLSPRDRICLLVADTLSIEYAWFTCVTGT